MSMLVTRSARRVASLLLLSVFVAPAAQELRGHSTSQSPIEEGWKSMPTLPRIPSLISGKKCSAPVAHPVPPRKLPHDLRENQNASRTSNTSVSRHFSR